MAVHLLKKTAIYVLTVLIVVSVNFCIVHLMPGDALVHLLGEEGYARLNETGGEHLAKVKKDFGMNGSFGEKYRRYVLKTLTLDWGFTYHHGRPVSEIVAQRMAWTLALLVPSVLITTIFGAVIGVLSGGYKKSRLQKILPIIFLTLYSFPAYSMGLLFLTAAACSTLLPMGGMMPENAGQLLVFKHMLLPLTVLVLHGTAYKAMIMRGAVLQELERTYVLTALSKGLSNSRVLFVHILKNALPPYLSAVALHIGFMVGGALFVEVVFSWQGMGDLIYQAVLSRDYPLLSASLMVLSLFVIFANFAADLVYGLLDIRIREGVYGPQ